MVDPSIASDVPVTQILSTWIVAANPCSERAITLDWARHALLDWIAGTIAGADEPLVRMLIDEYAAPESGPCSVLGTGLRVRPLDAALINGAAGHALDYDDATARMMGHPSAAVIPAALAMAQVERCAGRALLESIVIGHEVESRVGDMILPGHYLHGFHTTGTIGTLGAAAAAARLKRLDDEQTRHALGLAATQAAGLKSMFGTMAKPFHAGKAAMSGLMAVQLAARGFTAATDAIECAQGFARTLAPAQSPFDASMDMASGLAIEATLFKYHAACYFTHSAIEAARRLRDIHGVKLDAMESVRIHVDRTLRGVCDIAEPSTGLQLKFSIQHLVLLALDGVDTAAPDLYCDATACDPRLAAARRRVTLAFTEGGDSAAASVELTTRRGQTLTQRANVATPAQDLEAQWNRLLGKARAIAGPALGAARFKQLVDAIRMLDDAASLDPLQAAIQ